MCLGGIRSCNDNEEGTKTSLPLSFSVPRAYAISRALNVS